MRTRYYRTFHGGEAPATVLCNDSSLKTLKHRQSCRRRPLPASCFGALTCTPRTKDASLKFDFKRLQLQPHHARFGSIRGRDEHTWDDLLLPVQPLERRCAPDKKAIRWIRLPADRGWVDHSLCQVTFHNHSNILKYSHAKYHHHRHWPRRE